MDWMSASFNQKLISPSPDAQVEATGSSRERRRPRIRALTSNKVINEP